MQIRFDVECVTVLHSVYGSAGDEFCKIAYRVVAHGLLDGGQRLALPLSICLHDTEDGARSCAESKAEQVREIVCKR